MESNELEQAPAVQSSTVIVALAVKVDSSELDAALLKAEQLKAASTAALNDLGMARNKEKIVDVLCQLAVGGIAPHRLTEVGEGLTAAIAAVMALEKVDD